MSWFQFLNLWGLVNCFTKSLHHEIILEWFENFQSLYPCQLKKLATSTSTSVLMEKPQVDGHHGESWRGNLSRARWLPILVTALVAPILARLLPPYAKILIFRVKCLRDPTTRGAYPYHEEHSLQLLLLVVGSGAPRDGVPWPIYPRIFFVGALFGQNKVVETQCLMHLAPFQDQLSAFDLAGWSI